jgi:anti-sigma B factor antagonist
MSLSIQSRLVGNVAILDLSGRFSSLDGLILIDAVRTLIETGTRQFVLNLAELAYLDSFGLEQLISAYTATRNKGGDVKLVKPTERVGELLRMTKLDTVFEIVADESSAIQSVTKAAGKSA